VLPIYPPEVWALRVYLRKPAPRSTMRSHTRCPPRSAAGDFFQGHGEGVRGDGAGHRDPPGFPVHGAGAGAGAGAGQPRAHRGYTLANDVSARDIERENPLYLPQSKIYDGCCALGPVLVPADDMPDPCRLEITCTITRGGSTLFSGGVSTARLHRRFETLVEYLTRANHVPCGAVLLTGTGIIVPGEAALAPGDSVTIRVAEIGELTNHAVIME